MKDDKERYISSDELVGGIETPKKRERSEGSDAARNSVYDEEDGSAQRSEANGDYIYREADDDEADSDEEYYDSEEYDEPNDGSYAAYDENGDYIGRMYPDGTLRKPVSKNVYLEDYGDYPEMNEEPQRDIVPVGSTAAAEYGEAYDDAKEEYTEEYDNGEEEEYTKEYDDGEEEEYTENYADEEDDYTENQDNQYYGAGSAKDYSADEYDGYGELNQASETGRASRRSQVSAVDPMTVRRIAFGAGIAVMLGLIIWLVSLLIANGNYTSANSFSFSHNDDGTVIITGYNGSDTEVRIPVKISGNKVTAIGESAFSGSAAQSITLPEGVVSVAANAFGGCEELLSVSLPASTVEIASAFDGSPKLSGISVSEENPEYSAIDGVLFNKAQSSLVRCPEGKTGSVTLPETCTIVEANAFSSCALLDGAVLNNGLESIMNEAFSGCALLDISSLPSGLSVIGSSAFEGCTALKSLSTIPGSVRSIGERAFASSGLDGIVITEGVESISAEAFAACGQLLVAEIPASVNSIDISAFSGCTSLTAVDVNENSESFSSVSGILLTKAPISILHVPAAFAGKLELPSGLAEIGDNVFENCTGLTELVIPNTVTKIGEYAFGGCTSLTGVSIPNSVTAIGGHAFEKCALRTVNVGGAKTIGDSAFSDCASLESANLGKATSIGEYAFYNCTALKNFEIPTTVTSIGEYAFNGSKIGKLEFSKNLVRIGAYAFDGCASLGEVTFNNDNVALGIACFNGNIGNCEFHGNFGSTAETYADDHDIEFMPFDGDDYTVKKGDGKTVEITGYTGKAAEITLPETIGGYKVTAVSGIKGSAITSITIPSGVTNLTNEFLNGLTGLKKITVATGNGTYSSSDGVLYKKSGSVPQFCPLAKTGALAIAAGTKTIPAGVFAGRKLGSVTIPASVTSIEASAFKGCTSLSSIKITSGVTALADSVFDGCTALSSVELSESLESIGGRSFGGCTALKQITIGENVTNISSNAFEGCTELTITGVSGSAAYHFAAAQGFTFASEDGAEG